MTTVEIIGFCRACGHPRLIRNRAAQVVCTHAFCPDPWKTNRILTEPIERMRLPHAEDMRR